MYTQPLGIIAYRRHIRAPCFQLSVFISTFQHLSHAHLLLKTKIEIDRIFLPLLQQYSTIKLPMVTLSSPPSKPSTPYTSSKKKKKRAIKKKVVQPLPKLIRDEIRLCCALRAFSTLKCGNTKRLKDQYDDMANFITVKSQANPAKLLCCVMRRIPTTHYLTIFLLLLPKKPKM